MRNDGTPPAPLPKNLPDLPQGWQYLPLSCLIEEDRGISYGIVQPGTADPQGVSVLRVNNLKDGRVVIDDVLKVSPEVEAKYKRSRLRGGEVLLSLVGSLGECAIAPDALRGWNVARAVGVIPIKSSMDPRWIAFCLRSWTVQHYISAWATTTVQATFNLRDLARLPIPVPPNGEREAITRILGALDDKITLNRRMNETLEEMARAIFKSWFVDFDPVRAKTEGREPFGVDAETATLFPSSFDDSIIGKIPKGWGVRQLADIATLDRGLSYKGRFLGDEGTPMVNLGCFLGHGRFTRENLKFYSGEFQDRHLVGPGDIVIANTDITQARDILGSPALLPRFERHEKLLFSHHVYAVRMERRFEEWRPFVFFALLEPGFRERAEGFATGTTVLALPRDAVLGYCFPAPQEQLVRIFGDRISGLLRLTQLNSDESQTLKAVRDALLPGLISGRIRVNDAEKMVGEKV